MQRTQSRQTRILLAGLGVLALLAVWLLWTMLARRSATAASVSSAPTAESDAQAEMPDGLLPASSESQRAVRENAASALPAASADATAEGATELVEILVIDRANNKPLTKAQLVYWTYTEAEERKVKPWEWLSAGEFDAHLQHDSETLTSDADGKARVNRPKHSAIVAARAGELWGYAQLRHDADSPFRLELILDASFSARVVDTRDAPVAGALVALRMRSGDWFWDLLTTASRAPDGLAVLPHAGFMMRQNDAGQQPASIALGGVLDKPVEVALDPSHLPREPVRLVVPSTGACEVVVVGPDGEASADEFNVSLRQLGPEEMEQGDTPRWNHSAFMINGVHGRALFPHVTPGLELIATVSRPGATSSHSARGPGPTAAGRTATITVRLGETVAIVRGRALDANGSPLVNTKFHAWVEGDKETANGSDHNWQVESDDQGRFRVDFQPRTPDRGAAACVLILPDEHGVESASASRPLPVNLPPGVHDLGDFTLVPTPTIASGRVLDGDNAPVKSASVELSIKNPDSDSQENGGWVLIWNLRAVSDAQGRFVLRGRVKADTLSLTAQKDGSKAETVQVARGSTDVVLRMLATGEIAGRLLLDPSISKLGVQVFSERTDTDLSGYEELNPWAPTPMGDDGSFVVRNLRAGLYTVKIRLSGTWTELQTVEGVHVDTGATARDPRLNPLDLRTSLAVITVTIVDPDGQAVPQGMIQMTRSAQGGESHMTFARFENGKGTVTHDGHGVDLVLSSPGFCDARVEHVHDDQLVTMRRAPRVKLVLAGGQRPPEKPFWLGVNLVPADDSAAHAAWSDNEAYFDKDGRLSICAPVVGRMKVEFRVTFKPNENSWTQTGFASETETIIDVRDSATEQVFEITCDAQQLATTLEGLRKQ
jgi:hypothetical protein